MLDGEGTDEEERNMRFSFSTPREIARGMKRVWDSKMGTPSSARIIASSSSPWVEKNKTNKIWICESVGKLKGIGKQGEVKNK